MLPHHKIINRGIDIFIPETIFYRDGEPQAIYMNKEIEVKIVLNKDCRIKKVKK